MAVPPPPVLLSDICNRRPRGTRADVPRAREKNCTPRPAATAAFHDGQRNGLLRRPQFDPRSGTQPIPLGRAYGRPCSHAPGGMDSRPPVQASANHCLRRRTSEYPLPPTRQSPVQSKPTRTPLAALTRPRLWSPGPSACPHLATSLPSRHTQFARRTAAARPAYHGCLRRLTLWRVNAATRIAWPLNQHIRRLPPHGRSPFRSCPRLVLCQSELHLVYCPPIDSRFRTGDLHPTSSRPCGARTVHRSRDPVLENG